MSSPKILHEVLPNGLAVLLREVHAAPVAELQVWAKVGAADERPGEEGLAHFFEHMLFKGTERRGVGEIAGEIEGVGGRVNAYTSHDVTVYHATLPSDQIAVGLDVLADAVQRSQFDPAEIAREIEVVLEEIRRADDSPGHVLGDAVFQEAFRVHPYRHPILGTRESVASFDRERVVAFFRRWYTPEHFVFVAAGDFDAARLLGEVRAAFAEAQPGSARRARPVEPPFQGLRTRLLERPFERASLELAWPAPAFRDPDAPLLDLLAFIFGEGDSSRLVRRVKEEEGLADRIDASSYTPLDAGLFSASVDCDPACAEAAIEAVVREAERLRVEPVTPEELERARANFLASEHFERESVTGMARKLGSFEVLGGDWRSEERYFAAVRAATPAELLRVARRTLDPVHLTAAALLPSAARSALDEARIRAAVERGRARTARAFARPASLPPASDVLGYRLANGASLFVAPRREVPVVALRAASLGGLLAEDEKTAGLSSFLASMWVRGTRSRSAADFARSIESLAASVDGLSGRSSVGLTLDATSAKLAPALELFAEALLEPAFDAEEVERERRDTLADLARREDRLGQRSFDLFTATHYAAHPYRYPVIGLAESVRGFTPELVEAHHARLVQAGNLVLGVAGDVDPDAVATRLSSLLCGLDGGDFVPPAPPIEPAPREIRVAELRKARAQAHLVLGFRGLDVRDGDRFALEVLSQVLAGQGGRLFLELRDRQGLAYSVSAMNVEGVAPGFFALYIGTAPEKLEQAKQGMLQQLERLLDAAPAPEELLRAQRYLTGNFAIDQQRSAVRAAHLALDALYGLGADQDRHYAERVQAVTQEDLLRVARRVLDLSAYTLALIRPD